MSSNRSLLALALVLAAALFFVPFPFGVGRGGPAPNPIVTISLASDSRVTAVWLEGPMEVRFLVNAPPNVETVARWKQSEIRFRERAEGGTEFAFPVAAVEPLEGTQERVWRLAVDPLPGRGWFRWVVDSISEEGATNLVPTKFVPRGWTASWFEPETLDSPAWSLWLPDSEPKAFVSHLQAVGMAQSWRERFRQPGRLELHAVTVAPLAGLEAQADRPFSLAVGFAADPIPSTPETTPEGEVHRANVILDEPHDPASGPLDVVVAFETGIESDLDAPPQRLDLRPRWKADASPDQTKDTNPVWLPPWVADASPGGTIRAEDDPEAIASQTIPFDLDGGDPEQGRLVFLSKEAKCATCHKVGGDGGVIGPALDRPELARHNRAWWYRQIAEPSAVIAPNVRTHVAQLADGRVLSGVVRVVDFQILTLAGNDGTIETLKRGDLAALNPSSSSTMPSGLTGALGEQRLRDLLAYLLDSAARSQPRP